jgi:SAM-dependent methyltransferase
MSEASSASSTFSGDAESYERLMGRWSRCLAGPFLEFAGIGEGEAVLDVGCGTGSLAFELVARAKVAAVTGIDLSEAYIACARSRADHGRISFETGDACALPYGDASFDRALSLLVLNFVPDAPAAAGEMVRVTRPGGVVAAAVWDLRGGLPAFRMFWDTAAASDPAAAAIRARYFAGPYTRPGELAAAWMGFGLRDVVQDGLTIRMEFDSFGDFWRPLLGRTGPAGTYLAGLPEAERAAFESRVRAAYEAGDPDGPRSFAATAWACRGRVPD